MAEECGVVFVVKSTVCVCVCVCVCVHVLAFEWSRGH